MINIKSLKNFTFVYAKNIKFSLQMEPFRPAVIYTLFLIFGTGITQIEVGDGYNSNREKNNSTLCKSQN